MRPIDADALYDKAEMWYKGAHTPFRKIYRSFVDAVADAPTIDQPQNDPLTPEKLREMDGEPVWVQCLSNEDYSGLIIMLETVRPDFPLQRPDWQAQRWIGLLDQLAGKG